MPSQTWVCRSKAGWEYKRRLSASGRNMLNFQFPGRLTALSFPRLNSKVKPRDVAVKDLVTDLSDGVQSRPLTCGNTG